MERINVKSSRIQTIGYNKEGGILEIILKNGYAYIHQEVPVNFWRELMLADSIGKYYFNNIHKTFPYDTVQWVLEEE